MARDWNQYYADPGYTVPEPDPLLMGVVDGLAPGRALDLACGTGRHAIYLARLGWEVVAVDASPVAIDLLRQAEPEVDAQVTDLEGGEFRIEPSGYDLICDFYYLQRDLFPSIRDGVRPGGVFVGAVHVGEGHFSIPPGELRDEFAGWKISYYSEGPEPGRSRRSARIIARRA